VRPDPGRPKNTYVREDQILPHLAAVAILLASGNQAQGGGTVQISGPAETACLIDHLRTAGVTLTYDPDTRTIRTGRNSAVAVTVGRNTIGTIAQEGRTTSNQARHPPRPEAGPR
jgi:site-specific DNA recombinase